MRCGDKTGDETKTEDFDLGQIVSSSDKYVKEAERRLEEIENLFEAAKIRVEAHMISFGKSVVNVLFSSKVEPFQNELQDVVNAMEMQINSNVHMRNSLLQSAEEEKMLSVAIKQQRHAACNDA